MIHYHYFKSTDEWVNLGIGYGDSTICASTITLHDSPPVLIHYPYWLTYIRALKVDIGIGSTNSGTPVYYDQKKNS